MSGLGGGVGLCFQERVNSRDLYKEMNRLNIMILEEDRKLWCRDTTFLLGKHMRNTTYILGVISMS